MNKKAVLIVQVVQLYIPMVVKVRSLSLIKYRNILMASTG